MQFKPTEINGPNWVWTVAIVFILVKHLPEYYKGEFKKMPPGILSVKQYLK